MSQRNLKCTVCSGSHSRLHCTFICKSCGGDYRHCECETVKRQSRPNKHQRNAEACETDSVTTKELRNRHLANKLPTVGRQSADKRPTVGRLLAEKAVNDSRPTVGRLLVDCRPAVGRLLSNSRPTVFWGSCSSLFPKCWFLMRARVKNRSFQKKNSQNRDENQQTPSTLL
mgnify:CR=1 FL=1